MKSLVAIYNHIIQEMTIYGGTFQRDIDDGNKHGLLQLSLDDSCRMRCMN